MIETSKQLSVRILALVALALSACNPDAAGQIPCVEDISCPNDYPVCGPAGKCIAGTSSAGASVAIVGAEGHAAADFLKGTVRVLVSARASTGVKSVSLSSGSTNFAASAPAAAPPLYAFDVNTTTLADGDAPLTATLTAGDGATGTASGTLHVDNAKPVITSFTVAGGATAATITSGKAIALTASFTGDTATISAGPAGSVSLTNGGSVLVSPDVQTTYKLTVTSRSGVTASSGVSPTPDVTVSVVPPASFAGSFTVAPNVIDQDEVGTFTFTAGAAAAGAEVKDGTGATVGTIGALGTLAGVSIPPNPTSATQLVYTLVVSNGATTPDTVSVPVVVRVRPTISSFKFQSTTTSSANFAPGDDVVFSHAFNAQGGSASINGTTASGGATTINNIQASTLYTLTVTNPDGVSVTRTISATLSRINSFSAAAATISHNATTTLSASFAGSGPSGNVPAALSCATACVGTLGGTTIADGGTVSITGSVDGALTYTLKVTASTGSQLLSNVTVNVVPDATGVSLVANTNVIHTGGVVLLKPTFNLNNPVVAGTGTIVGVEQLSGVQTTYAVDSGLEVGVAPIATTVYTLHVVNGAGKEFTPAPSVTVTVAPGSWSLLNDAPSPTNSDVRGGATVTALGTGKVLIAGGLDLTGQPINTAVICDASGSCIVKSMGSNRAFHTAVMITSGTHNGQVLLAGGYALNAIPGDPPVPTDTAQFFDPVTETFSGANSISPTGPAKPRARHVAVLLPGGSTVLIAGGTDGSANLDTAIKYDTTATPSAQASGNMARARADFTGTLIGPKVLIVGGLIETIADDRKAELFDPGAAGTFSDTDSLPVGEDKRGHTAVLLDGQPPNAGKVLISGGVTGNGGAVPLVQSPAQVLYDPVTNTFSAAASMIKGRSHHAATLLPTHAVLLCGGTTLPNGSDTVASCERFDSQFGGGTQFPTAPMLKPRKDFGLAPITIATVVEMLAAGGVDAATTTFAETYNTN